MSLNSRAKGKAGELELSAFLRDFGFAARRGQQFKGGGDSPDVLGLPGFHIECKRVEQGNPYDWLNQAERDSKTGDVPVVFHRRNRTRWIVVIDALDFLHLAQRGVHDARETHA
jgi:Holliday junction resolvase